MAAKKRSGAVGFETFRANAKLNSNVRGGRRLSKAEVSVNQNHFSLLHETSKGGANNVLLLRWRERVLEQHPGGYW
jgi:hypothetical protein